MSHPPAPNRAAPHRAVAHPLRHRAHRATPLLVAVLLALAGAAQAQTYGWTGGTFTAGLTAPGTLGATEVLNIGAGGFKYFDGGVSHFTNGGTVNWLADTLYLQNGAQVTNHGLWNAQGDLALVYNGGAGPAFLNVGTLRKSAGSGSTTVAAGVGFVNFGSVVAQIGSIDFQGGSTFNAGSAFSGAGLVRMVSGSNVFNGAFSASNLDLSGGSHVGSGAVLNGTVGFSGGSLTGTWAVAAGQTLEGRGGGFKFVDGAGTVLSNNGTVRWATADALYLQNGSQVVNKGLWDSSTDSLLAYNGGAATTFTNLGTLRKSGGSGATTINNGAGFVNHGVLDAQVGELLFNGGSTFNAGSVFTGAGRNRVVAGSNQFNGAFTAQNLELANGTHVGNGAVVGGNLAFSGGSLAGTWAVAAGQQVTAGSGAFKFIDGAGTVLSNQGTVAWNSGEAFYLQSGAKVLNQGLWQANADTALLYNGGAQPSFENTASGTLLAAAGRLLTVGNVLVNNGGTLQADAGAAIHYTGGAQFNHGSVFSGAGANVAMGNNGFTGTQVSGNLELRSGTHTGNNAVVNGQLAFSGGVLAGSWQVAAGHALTGVDGGFKIMDGAGTVLDNHGTVAWNTANALYLQSGAVLNNAGLFVSGANTALLYNGGARPLFNNTGTLRASAGTTLTVGNVLRNHGGTLDAAAGATITYTGGAEFNAGTRFTGAGINAAAGNNGFNGAFTSANLELRNGIHSGNGAVLQGSARFAGGQLVGTWQVAAGAAMRIEDGAFKYLDGAGTVLDNRGTLAWNSANALYLQNGATLANAGTLDLRTDAGIFYNGGAATSLVNTGLVLKSGGAGTATIGDGTGFNNLGTVDVQSGTLALPGNFTNLGTLKGVGSYSVAGTLTNAGTLAPGASLGTLALVGNYAQTAGGSFAVDLQSLASHDLFNVSGTAALDGGLALSCHGACSFAVGDVVTILDSVGDLSGSFTSVTMSGFNTGAFNVIYDSVADRVQLQVTQAVTAVPEPGTAALWLAGLGMFGRLVRRRTGTGLVG